MLTIGRNQRVDDIGDKSIHNGRKCCADDNGYGEIDHVAAQDKIAKSFKHRFS